MTEQEYDKEQLRILRNAFKAFDHDEKGTIEHSDVQSILEILGQKLEPPAVKKLIAEVDKGNSGKLDFSQFCKLAARFIEVEEDASALQSELKEAFRVYDKEGKGYLTVATLRGILHELDDKISNQDLDLIIEEIDADGSGTVDFDEFMTVMTGKNFEDFTIHRRFVFCEPSYKPNVCIPPPRHNLHRRIEWHFERWFQQMQWQPFEYFRRQPAYPPQSTSRACTARSIEVQTSTTDVGRTSCCCHHGIFRQRFPKWVPILTLYRDIVQNPFRRRQHYMIAHH